MTNATRIALALLLAFIAWALAYWLTPPGPAASTDRYATGGGATPSVTFDPAPPDGIDDPLNRPGAFRGEGAAPGEAVDIERPPAAEPTGSTSGAASGETPDEDDELPAIIPPEFILHTVAAGETPNSISKKYYGTTRRWDVILRANPLKDLHRRLRVGMVIRVPKDPDNIQGVPRDESGEPEDDAGTDAALEYLEYRVKRGDTLTGIAHTIYGRASLWTLIRDANPKVGSDGTKLRSGMTLRIPPKPAEE